MIESATVAVSPTTAPEVMTATASAESGASTAPM
jgi:hypothetical protein